MVELLLKRSGSGTRYSEWIERAILNGVLGTLRGEEPGAYLYFLPLGTYVTKNAPQAWRHAGWSTPFGDFWCCQGTVSTPAPAAERGARLPGASQRGHMPPLPTLDSQ